MSLEWDLFDKRKRAGRVRDVWLRGVHDTGRNSPALSLACSLEDVSRGGTSSSLTAVHLHVLSLRDLKLWGNLEEHESHCLKCIY